MNHDRETPEPAEGGEPACWAHLVCPECGALDGEGHHAGCTAEHPARRPDAAPEPGVVLDSSADQTSSS